MTRLMHWTASDHHIRRQKHSAYDKSMRSHEPSRPRPGTSTSSQRAAQWDRRSSTAFFAEQKMPGASAELHSCLRGADIVQEISSAQMEVRKN